jgi:hypothetical protein
MLTEQSARTIAANTIARALLQYAQPGLVAWDLRYQAAELALDVVDRHLVRNVSVPDACPAGAACPQQSSTDVILDTMTLPVAEPIAEPPSSADVDPSPRPGWLLRALTRVVGDGP